MSEVQEFQVLAVLLYSLPPLIMLSLTSISCVTVSSSSRSRAATSGRGAAVSRGAVKTNAQVVNELYS